MTASSITQGKYRWMIDTCTTKRSSPYSRQTLWYRRRKLKSLPSSRDSDTKKSCQWWPSLACLLERFTSCCTACSAETLSWKGARNGEALLIILIRRLTQPPLHLRRRMLRHQFSKGFQEDFHFGFFADGETHMIWQRGE